MVARPDPFHCTEDALVRPLPATVMVNDPAPTVAEAGKIEASVGNGFVVTANEATCDAPPPGAGLITVTENDPALVRSGAVIEALSCVPLRKVVVRFRPFHCTCEVLTNPLPFTASEKPAELAAMAAGARPRTAGKGLLTTNDAALDVPPAGAGLMTVTVSVPALARSAAVIAAVNCVALM